MSMQTVAHSQYARAAAVTASPAEVVRMAYERIIAACDRATLAHLTPGGSWLQIFHDETVRAQAILMELASVLAVGHPNPAVDEMAKSLDGIYAFAAQQLATANIEKSAEPLRAVRRMIDGLRDAWVTAS